MLRLVKVNFIFRERRKIMEKNDLVKTKDLAKVFDVSYKTVLEWVKILGIVVKNGRPKTYNSDEIELLNKFQKTKRKYVKKGN
jgi:transposase